MISDVEHFLTKKARAYNGVKIVSSINDVGRSGLVHSSINDVGRSGLVHAKK